jgi:inhibitor of cysteine peptidase
VVGSRQKLLELLAKDQQELPYRGRDIMTMAKPMDSGAPASAAKENSAASPEFSGTNLQVQGVDEGDMVKTDGQYIYQARQDSVVITRAYPADNMEVLKTISYQDTMHPVELYIDHKSMVVIGYSYGNRKTDNLQKRSMPYYSDEVVAMKVYDISDKSNIKEVREIQLDGSYLSSRKIDSQIYLLTNKYISYYGIRQDESLPDTPRIKDSMTGMDFKKLGYDQIRYFPDSAAGSYLVVAGLNLDTYKESLHVDTYLGAGEEIYCSAENLYAAVTSYQAPPVNPVVLDTATSAKGLLPRQQDKETVIYRFALEKGKAVYKAKGTVPGTLLNQFSMDEHGDTFRVATTTGEVWGFGESSSKNNLYVLDKSLKTMGRLENIAPGESIYSVRFMGDRAYMVTFKKVDPLFVIDLKDGTKPQILGALKIPGYSNYLHPYDENHVLGFGKDTVEIPYEDDGGNVIGSNAYYLGMKVALFDITDVTKPKELYVETIGDRGTDSPLLQDHKALLFSREKNLLAFPITVMRTEGAKTVYNRMPAYGSFSFQGAYVYHIDLEKGFRLKGTITHLSQEDYNKSGTYGTDYNKSIHRILYIGDRLYTVSNSAIKANDMKNLKEINHLEIK